jgi:hypothetical protein
LGAEAPFYKNILRLPALKVKNFHREKPMRKRFFVAFFTAIYPNTSQARAFCGFITLFS